MSLVLVRMVMLRVVVVVLVRVGVIGVWVGESGRRVWLGDLGVVERRRMMRS